MKTIALVLVLAVNMTALAQEKPAPKDSERIFIPGCARNRVFTVGPRREDQPGRSDLAPGTRLLMNGPKKLLDEIKSHQSGEIELTGLIRKSDLKQPGVRLGDHVRIGPGPAPTGANPGRDVYLNQAMIDVEGWRALTASCASR
ncbi:MAG: hypothetical protein ACRD2N_24205 [Vicinamibacterales bacterium]